jgi:proteasome lid subunit RPN8/RPN11
MIDLLNADWSAYYTPTIERCGVILDTGEVVELSNVSETPSETFEISDKDLASVKGAVTATWHTHCGDDPNLSLPDYEMFVEQSHLKHFIISLHYVVVYGFLTDTLLVLGSKKR